MSTFYSITLIAALFAAAGGWGYAYLVRADRNKAEHRAEMWFTECTYFEEAFAEGNLLIAQLNEYIENQAEQIELFRAQLYTHVEYDYQEDWDDVPF